MSYGFKDFFVGVVYVFVIFLPGALLIGVLGMAFPDLLTIFGPLDDASAVVWLGFLGASFFFGHLVSLVGASVEDSIRVGWKRRHHDGERVSAGLRATAGAIVRSRVPAVALDKDDRRWAAAILRQDEAPSYREVERKDADRRFFRNVSIVLFLGTVPGIADVVSWTQHPELGLDRGVLLSSAVAALLGLLSALRYMNQDGGYTKLVFECLILACRQDDAERSESWELRWFGEGDVPSELDAAFRTSLTTGPDERVDQYARATGDATGLKLREGWLEVKSRVDRVEGAHGVLEHWTKLRFRGGVAESGAGARPDLWLAVTKRRRLRKFVSGEAGELQEVDAAARAESGCQAEVTELVVEGRRAWTLGFEAFGPEERQRALLGACVRSVLPELTDGTTRGATSCGYPEWLSGH